MARFDHLLEGPRDGLLRASGALCNDSSLHPDPVLMSRISGLCDDDVDHQIVSGVRRILEDPADVFATHSTASNVFYVLPLALVADGL